MVTPHAKSFTLLSVSIFILFLTSGYISHVKQGSGWTAPKEASEVKNPMAEAPKSVDVGEKIFGQQCWSCHGSSGQGDGPMASNLDPVPSNFTNALVQNQTDGALYWKLSEGRGNMAAYKHSLSEEQRWSLVNYIRTLK